MGKIGLTPWRGLEKNVHSLAQLFALSAKLAKNPPRTRLDLVTLAEIAGYRALWRRPCDSWEKVRARLGEEYGEDRAFHSSRLGGPLAC